MINRRLFRNLLIGALIAMNLGCDQISKSVVRESIDYYEQIRLLKDNVILTKVENTGAFLGLGGELPEPVRHVLFLLLPVVILVILGVMLFKRNLRKGAIIGASFIIGGGLGNLFDRIVYGSVTDFLHIDLGLFRTGIFNMADMSIMIGMLTLLYLNLYSNLEKEDANRLSSSL